MIFPTPAAELAELAAECLAIERMHGNELAPQAPRNATRDMLTDHARDLGIPEADIEAEIDRAIKTAAAQ